MANDMKTLKVVAENGAFSFPVVDQTARNAASTAQSTAQSASQAAAAAQQAAQAAQNAVDKITIPTALPNPYKLTFTGGATGTYDGTKAVTINIPTGGEGGGGSSPVQYVESLDESNLANLRDLATGTYVLYGYFYPYPGATDTLTCDNTLVSVAHLTAGSHVLVFNPLNCKVNFLEILVSETEASGFTYSAQIIDMRDLPALIEAVGSRDDLATEDKTSIVAAINEVAANGGSSDSSQNANVMEPADDDIPKVFFGGALQQTKDEKVVPFRYISKTADFSGYAEIKAQGDSSMGYPKKNQTVKLFKDADCTEKLKVDFKGWGKQNKHVYKANWIDLSHARNVVSARLWADVVKSRSNYAELPELLRTAPNQGAVDGFPVKVYADGIYQGRYTLNIPKDKWMANMDDELETHCILCGELSDSGWFRAPANINGSDWSDEVHDTVPTSIKTRWNEVISFVMNSTDDEFRANLGEYFFIDSLIDYYLFGLAICDLDGYRKNQIYMTYDGVKWIASAYDKDSTWGLWWTGKEFVPADSWEQGSMAQDGSGNLLYIRLEQLFWAELQTRWAELKNGALSIENIINRFERFTDIAPAELVKEDYASTTGGGEFTGIPSQTTNNIQQIRSFALARQVWTDEYVASLTPVEQTPCEGIALSATELTFDGDGTQTLTATVTPADTTDTVVWASSMPSVASITVENNVCTVRGVSNGDAVISVTCGEHSASCTVSVRGIEEVTLSSISATYSGGDVAEGTAVTALTGVVVTAHYSDGSTETVTGYTLSGTIAKGDNTITVSYGGKTATFTVVGVALTALYSLPEVTTFDGTNYIDTGLKLFEKDIPFTVLVDWTHTGAASWEVNSHVVIQCMEINSPWNGLIVQYNAATQGLHMEIKQNNSTKALSYATDKIATADTENVKIVFTKDDTGALTIYRRYNNSGDVLKSATQGTYTKLTDNLLIGCTQKSDGTYDRFAKGVLNECAVYGYAMSADEVNAWMTA